MKENVRSLDTIADDINQLARGNIFDIGDLLIEAKAQCEHGQWLDWLYAEFDWSVDTAKRYMKVAELSAKFRNLRNLKLGSTTLYQLADHENEDALPTIIEELAKHAVKTRLKPSDAERVIQVGIGRRRFGDRPEATLVKLVELDQYDDKAWHEKAVIALQERNPETDDDANSIVNDIVREHRDAELLKEAEERERRDEMIDESDDIIDGPPPDLPPPTRPPEPQRIGAGTTWAEREPFDHAVTELLGLRAKPIARFIGMFSSAELYEVSEFLAAVAAANKQAAA
jgi:hypothetical protein